MKYSKITYTYTGGDTVFGIPFEYLDKDYIHIYVNDVELETADFEIEEQTVVINKKLNPQDKVSIERNTSLRRLVNFTGRNDLKSFDLNLALTQVLHVMQEEKDSLAEIMPQTPSGDWNAEYKRLTNLAPAVSPADAVRKDQILSLTYEGMGDIENKVAYLLNAKSKPDGYAPLDEDALIPKSFIPHYTSSLPLFCVNSGIVDEQGNPALLTVEDSIITALAPFTYTTAAGYTYTQSENLTFDITDFETGLYNIFINPDNNSLELYNNKIFNQNFMPDNMTENDIWLNAGIFPAESKIMKQESLVDTSLVPLGRIDWKNPSDIGNSEGVIDDLEDLLG